MIIKKLSFQTVVQTLPIILSLILTILILSTQRFLPFHMPLFYSLSWGEGQLATIPQFLIIPAIISCITLINLMIIWQLHKNQILLKQILLLSSLAITGILTFTILKVVFIFI